MKSLILLITLIFSFTANASFIESSYLYGLSKRHTEMVAEGTDSFLELEYENHGKFVNIHKMVKNIKKELTGVLSVNTEKMSSDPTTRWEMIMDALGFESQPFFCIPLADDPENVWANDGEDCQLKVEKLFGDAMEKADSIYMVLVDGDYYGDYSEFQLIFSDYETKETVTLRLPLYHEI